MAELIRTRPRMARSRNLRLRSDPNMNHYIYAFGDLRHHLNNQGECLYNLWPINLPRSLLPSCFCFDGDLGFGNVNKKIDIHVRLLLLAVKILYGIASPIYIHKAAPPGFPLRRPGCRRRCPPKS